MAVVRGGVPRSRAGAGGRIAAVLAMTVPLLVSPVVVGSATAATSPPGPPGATAPPRRPVPPLPASYISVSVSPRSGSVVGVAYPITARFSSPVANRALAERHMPVFVNGVFSRGAWYWKDAMTAVFRTAGLWPGHARIQVRLTLGGVQLASSSTYRFLGAPSTTRRYSLTTARALVAYINGITDRMVVKVDGRVVKVFKVSLGRKGDETRSGIKAVMEKYVLRHMTSVAAGITDPRDQYDLQVPYAVRITPTGEFVHGAPWATRRIGVYNGSHGCTNLFVPDAHWFFDHVLPGDAVITTGTGRAMEYWNGIGAPYNMPWQQWLSRSALKGRP